MLQASTPRWLNHESTIWEHSSISEATMKTDGENNTFWHFGTWKILKNIGIIGGPQKYSSPAKEQQLFKGFYSWQRIPEES